MDKFILASPGLQDSQIVLCIWSDRRSIKITSHQAVINSQFLRLLPTPISQHKPMIRRATHGCSIVKSQFHQLRLAACDARGVALTDHDALTSVHRVDIENFLGWQLSKFSERAFRAVEQLDLGISGEASPIS